MAIRQRIEGPDAAVFPHPVLLSGKGLLLGLRYGQRGGNDGIVDAGQKVGVVAPFAEADAALCRRQKPGMVFLAILHQHAESLRGLLLAGDQEAQFARRFVKAQMGEVEQGLQWKS